MGGSWIVGHLGVFLNFRFVDGVLDRRAFKKRDLGCSMVGFGTNIKSSVGSRSTNGNAVNFWMVQIRITDPESEQEDEREEKSTREERRFWREIVIGRFVEKDMVISRDMSADDEE
jgi:hypothetical protein